MKAKSKIGSLLFVIVIFFSSCTLVDLPTYLKTVEFGNGKMDILYVLGPIYGYHRYTGKMTKPVKAILGENTFTFIESATLASFPFMEYDKVIIENGTIQQTNPITMGPYTFLPPETASVYFEPIKPGMHPDDYDYILYSSGIKGGQTIRIGIFDITLDGAGGQLEYVRETSDVSLYNESFYSNQGLFDSISIQITNFPQSELNSIQSLSFSPVTGYSLFLEEESSITIRSVKFMIAPVTSLSLFPDGSGKSFQAGMNVTCTIGSTNVEIPKETIIEFYESGDISKLDFSYLTSPWEYNGVSVQSYGSIQFTETGEVIPFSEPEWGL